MSRANLGSRFEFELPLSDSTSVIKITFVLRRRDGSFHLNVQTDLPTPRWGWTQQVLMYAQDAEWTIKQGESFDKDPELKEFLLTVLDRLQHAAARDFPQDKDASWVFGLHGPRGRPVSTLGRDFFIAVDVAAQHLSGVTVEAALAETARIYRFSNSICSEAWKRLNSEGRRFVSELLEFEGVVDSELGAALNDYRRAAQQILGRDEGLRQIDEGMKKLLQQAREGRMGEG